MTTDQFHSDNGTTRRLGLPSVGLIPGFSQVEIMSGAGRTVRFVGKSGKTRA